MLYKPWTEMSGQERLDLSYKNFRTACVFDDDKAINKWLSIMRKVMKDIVKEEKNSEVNQELPIIR